MSVGSSTFIFIMMMLGGVIALICLKSGFGLWCAMEVSFLGALPILIGKSCSEAESSFKYYIVQVVGSSFIILSFCFMTSGVISFVAPHLLLMTGFLLKLGLFPFFAWVPSVVGFAGWFGCMILLVFQKIGPYWILSGLGLPSWVLSGFIFSGVLTSLAGALGGLNQVMLRPLLGYSSLSHSGWLISLSLSDLRMFLFYFVVYSTLIISLIQLCITPKGVEVGVAISLYFLSMGGLPPLGGSFSKMGAIISLSSFSTVITGLLILPSLISLCYYLWFFIYITMNSSFKVGKSVLYHLIFNSLLGPVMVFWFLS